MMVPHALSIDTYGRLIAASIAGLWQGAVLALLAAGLMRLMPRASAALRHTVLVATFAVAAVLPWLCFRTIQTQSVSSHTLRMAPWLASAIAVAWLIVGCMRATSLLLAWRRLHAVRERAIPFVLEGQDGFNAGSRHAELCISSDVDSPTIVGFRQPLLLLPDWIAPLLTADDLRQIALHECEHLRRYDDWLNLLLQVVVVVSPLNPALVWLDRRIGTQRELACDAAVVAATAKPIAYATCLARLAEQRIRRNRVVLALAAIGHTSELGRRIHALLSQSAAWTQRQSRGAAGATAAILLAGAFGLARTPLLVDIAHNPETAVVVGPAEHNFASDDRLSAADSVSPRIPVVPVSFTLKPFSVAAPARQTKPQGSTRQKVKLNKVQGWPGQPHMIHTGSTISRPANHRTTSVHTNDKVTRVRFVTTVFSSPYFAVPVANGWLLFQL